MYSIWVRVNLVKDLAKLSQINESGACAEIENKSSPHIEFNLYQVSIKGPIHPRHCIVLQYFSVRFAPILSSSTVCMDSFVENNLLCWGIYRLSHHIWVCNLTLPFANTVSNVGLFQGLNTIWNETPALPGSELQFTLRFATVPPAIISQALWLKQQTCLFRCLGLNCPWWYMYLSQTAS